mmetsp:Transcript_56301/g.91114  ORF Transcript_56301/g.91114 Transcript_56301/m.91114 type:complete len:463 (+) Transcript_56301:76-1464(+)
MSSLVVLGSMVSASASVVTAAAMTYLAVKLSSGVSAQEQQRAGDRTPVPESSPKMKATKMPLDIDTVTFERMTSLGRDELKELKSVAFPNISGPRTGESLVIRDNPEAIMEMKSVFKKLCTSSKDLLSVHDVAKVHNLLGEPMDTTDEQNMMNFFNAADQSKASISFEMFMAWWSELHDSSADPDQYYSNERYRQRFKVLQSRLTDPKIAQIVTVTEGDPSSRRFRVFYEMNGDRLSPWHDIPLMNEDGSYNFITEIPKWTRKKYEIATAETMNPIKQDVKNGVLREYKWGDMMFNYGAFPQTWEDPKHVSEETGCPGDNDPVDVIELGTRQRPVGAITRVKILGVIAMIDDNETDWKILALAMDDDKASMINDLADLDAHMPGVTDCLTHWLRMYKTTEGKGENKFGCGSKPQGAAFAKRVVEETHEHWKTLIEEQQAAGKMKKKSGSNSNIFTELALDEN